MKTGDVMGVLIGAAVTSGVLFVIFGKEKTQKIVKDAADAVTEIFNGNGDRFDNGWRYFSDGTAIDEKGSYYFNGQLIWRSPQSFLT